MVTKRILLLLILLLAAALLTSSLFLYNPFMQYEPRLRTIKIHESTILTEDLGPFIETGLEICADNIVLDGAGHKIIGMGDGREQWGIYVDGRKNVTIKNVEVYGFQINIRITGSYNIQVSNCYVHHNFPDFRAQEGFYGIESKYNYNTLFMNNTIEYISDEGIHFSGSFWK